MRITLITLAGALTLAATASAQSPSRPIFEVRPFAGAYVPTGDHRQAFESAALVGMEAGVEVFEYVTLLGSVAWAAGKDKLPVGDNGVGMLQYDAGIEIGTRKHLASNWQLRPFVGGGIGRRSYNYDAPGVMTQTFFAGYGALGLELQPGRLGFRVEARDYLSRYRPPTLEITPAFRQGRERESTRNDLTFTLGVAYHLR